MRVSILSIAAIISSLILTSVLFSLELNVDPISAREESLDDSIILSVEEQAPIITEIGSSNNTLPVNEEIAEPDPVLKSDAPDLNLTVKGAVAIDVASDKIIFNQAAEMILPIASITKLATALVFLDNNPGWDNIYEIKADDKVNGGRVYLFPGEQVKLRDLFYLSLVASDNQATKALARSTGLNEDEFIARMNAKAGDLSLTNTKFSDPIGLNGNNVSTPIEIAQLAKTAFAYNEIIEATMTKRYEFTTLAGVKKSVANTDWLLKSFPQNGVKILGGKTGYIEAAGYCFVGKFINGSGHEVISVVLGGSNINDRFEQTKILIDWVYNNFEW